MVDQGPWKSLHRWKNQRVREHRRWPPKDLVVSAVSSCAGFGRKEVGLWGSSKLLLVCGKVHWCSRCCLCSDEQGSSQQRTELAVPGGPLRDGTASASGPKAGPEPGLCQRPVVFSLAASLQGPGLAFTPQSCRLESEREASQGWSPRPLSWVWTATSSLRPHAVTPLCVPGSSSLLLRTPITLDQDPSLKCFSSVPRPQIQPRREARG